MPSAHVDADAAAGGISLTGAVAVVDPAAAAVALVDVPVPTVLHWPADMLLQCGLHLQYRLQNIQINSSGHCFDKMGGIEVVAAGLGSCFRMLDEDTKTQAAAAIAMPVTKVIIAPH